MIDEWKHVPLLLNLCRVDGATSNKLIQMIISSLVKYGGVKEGNLAKKVICFEIDELIVFQGSEIGVTN